VTKNDEERLSILAGSLSMSLNLTEGFTFLEQTIGEESSTWIIHARPVPQDEPLNDSFFLNGRSLIPPLIITWNLEPNRRRPQLDLLKINLQVNDLLYDRKRTFAGNRLILIYSIYLIYLFCESYFSLPFSKGVFTFARRKDLFKDKLSSFKLTWD